MNFARTIYSNHTVLPRFVFTARTTRDFMTFLQKSYNISHRSLGHFELRLLYTSRIQYLIEYYLQARIQVRNLREFNPPRRYSAGSARYGTRKWGAGYKLDELRSRLTPPFPHPSAKLVEFSAILPPGNLNLVPRRYLPSLSEIYYGARPHKGRRRRHRRAPISNATSMEIERRIQIGPRGAG